MNYNNIQILTNFFKIFRDDLYPFLGGGNKGRKMNKISEDIIFKMHNALVTTGGIQSNHCRAVAVYAAQHHLPCTLVLHGSPLDFENQSGNAKIMRMSGANIVFVSQPSEIAQCMDEAMEVYRKLHLKPYYIWGGGHTLEGGLAYIDAVAELHDDCKKNNWMPDYIFLASGTGSTQAGIMAGLDLYGYDTTQVVGISVAREAMSASEIVEEFYFELCKQYNITCKGRSAVVLDDYLCGGYGKFNEELKALSDYSIRDYGFTLDTCYTGKAFYGMMDFVKKNNLQEKNILFWHTGGIFNFLAE